jgi:hypothetical protein
LPPRAKTAIIRSPSDMATSHEVRHPLRDFHACYLTSVIRFVIERVVGADDEDVETAFGP